MLDSSRVGVTTSPQVFDVEAGAIKRFAEAIGSTNPIHFDEAYAQRAGYSGLVAPPTFPACFQPRQEDLAGLDMAGRGVLLGEQAFEFERPIVAGDRIIVVRWVEEVGERDGGSGSMDFVSIHEEGTDANGKLVYRGRRVVVVKRSGQQGA